MRLRPPAPARTADRCRLELARRGSPARPAAQVRRPRPRAFRHGLRWPTRRHGGRRAPRGAQGGYCAHPGQAPQHRGTRAASRQSRHHERERPSRDRDRSMRPLSPIERPALPRGQGKPSRGDRTPVHTTKITRKQLAGAAASVLLCQAISDVCPPPETCGACAWADIVLPGQFGKNVRDRPPHALD